MQTKTGPADAIGLSYAITITVHSHVMRIINRIGLLHINVL